MHTQTETALSLAIQATPALLLTRVPEHERLDVLPRLFGKHMMLFEHTIYAQLEALSEDYTGGYWHFYLLANGGFYMAPDQKADLLLEVDGNGFHGHMSADAAGIVACLFAYSGLSFQFPAGPFAEKYHQLLEIADSHTEAAAIFQAID